jgi:hypothetical protein
VFTNRAFAPHPVKAQKAFLHGFQRIVFVSQQSPGVPIQPRLLVTAKLLNLVERILLIHEVSFVQRVADTVYRFENRAKSDHTSLGQIVTLNFQL